MIDLERKLKNKMLDNNGCNVYKNNFFKPIKKDEFYHQYQQIFLAEMPSNCKDAKRKDRIECCGDCTFFGDKGCTTSYLEAKWGSRNTPACSEFSPKEK